MEKLPEAAETFAVSGGRLARCDRRARSERAVRQACAGGSGLWVLGRASPVYCVQFHANVSFRHIRCKAARARSAGVVVYEML